MKGMLHRTSIAFLALAAGVAASACAAPPAMSLDSTTVARGHDVVVHFDKPIAGKASDLYWITLVPVEAPEPTALNRVVVDHGSTMVRLPATTPGSFEVRLHDRYPEKEYRLIARTPVSIVN
jgi:hypothetical protein